MDFKARPKVSDLAILGRFWLVGLFSAFFLPVNHTILHDLDRLN